MDSTAAVDLLVVTVVMMFGTAILVTFVVDLNVTYGEYIVLTLVLYPTPHGSYVGYHNDNDGFFEYHCCGECRVGGVGEDSSDDACNSWARLLL
jgi:hypothetical protein